MHMITRRRGRRLVATAAPPTRASRLLGASVLLILISAGCSSATARSRGETRLATHGQPTIAEDTVRMGYADYSRRHATGSVGSVVFRDGSRRPQVNKIEDLLSGRIAGVVVSRGADGSPSLRIHGVGTFRNSQPLLVVDGVAWPTDVPMRSLLMGINPGDVVRIDVLKDASSSAIYGSRAGNGVVLITLRHSGR